MKNILRHLEKYEKAVGSCLALPRREYTADTYHKLRVEIKKINALFDLIQYCSKDFNRKKIYRPYKLIFKQAGKVREIDIEEAILKKYVITDTITDTINAYRASLAKHRAHQQDVYFAMINKRSIGQLSLHKKKLAQHIAAIDKVAVQNYIQDKSNEIKNLLSYGIIENDQLHDLRKRIKTLNYNKKVVARYLISPDTSNKDKLGKLLGKWHDNHVIMIHLQKAIEKGGVDSPEAMQLKNIESRISAYCDGLLNKTYHALYASYYYQNNPVSG